MHRHLRAIHEHITSARPTGRLLSFLVVAGALAIAGIGELAEDIGSTEFISRLDVRLTQLAFNARSPQFLTASYIMTLLAQAGVIVAVTIAITTLLLLQRQRILLLGFALSFVVSEGAMTLTKLLIERPRPFPPIRALDASTFSFPSGHAATAVALYGYIAYLIVRTHHRWAVRSGAIGAAVVAIVAVDASRVALGMHYLSDVLAGNLVGTCGLLLGIGVTEWLLREHQVTPRLDARTLIAIALSILLAATALYTSDPTPWTRVIGG